MALLFSIRSGACLAMMAVMIFSFALKVHSRAEIAVDCCLQAKRYKISEKIDSCFEQMLDSGPCPGLVHAYIMTTKTRQWCLDPKYPWVKRAVKELEKNGAGCPPLGGVSKHTPLMTKTMELHIHN